MAQPVKKQKDLFFSRDYESVSRERVYLDIVTFIRESLKAILISYGDLNCGRVDFETIFGVSPEGLEYRSAYVDTIQVVGFHENHDHPTFGPRHQTDYTWLIIYYSEYHGHIPDEGEVFEIDEQRAKATIQEQMNQLAVAVASYFAGKTPPHPTHPTGTGGTGFSKLKLRSVPAWHENYYIAPEEVPKVHQALRDEIRKFKNQE